MKAKTYDDWKLLGYQVKKGQVSNLRDAQGRALFTRDQVREQYDLGDYTLIDEEFS